MAIKTAKTKVVKLKDLKPAKYNPRIDLQPGDPEFEKLRTSLKRFGYLDRIIYNERTGNIVGGHQRYKVMIDEGIEEAEVTVVDLDDADEKALNIALNKISGDWDDDMLAELLNDLNNQDYDLELTGFDSDEIDSMLNDFEDEQEVLDDEFDAEQEAELIVEPYVKKGDIWKLGPHTIVCGDSLNPDDVKAAADGHTMDMVLTDPPYNVALGYNETPEEAKKRNRRTDGKVVANDAMDNDEFYQFLKTAYTRMFEVTKKGGPIYVFHADSEGLNFRKAMIEAGWDFKQNLIWVKNAIVMGRQDYHWQHEPILYGWKPGAAHFWNGERDKSTVIDDDMDFRKLDKKELISLIYELKNDQNTSVIRHYKPATSEEHPTMKPVPLVARLIRNSSLKGHRVWDSFMGSGSTLIAADKTGRIAHGLEFSEVYAQVIVERYIRHKGNDGEDVKVIRNGKEIPYHEAATQGYVEVK